MADCVMLAARSVVAVSAAWALAGCTSQQVYYAGQAWQRNECSRVVDPGERERCLSNTSTTYDDYRRQTGDDRTR